MKKFFFKKTSPYLFVYKMETTVDSTENNTPVKMSKRQLKKIKRLLEYEKNKPERRAKERLKKKLKREAGVKRTGPTRRALQRNKISDSGNKLRVVLDFSFDHLMNPKDIAKCVKQLCRCYSANRRSTFPMKLHVVNLSGKSREELVKHDGYRNWDLFLHSEPYLELFPKEPLVYLTSDSDNTIEVLDDTKVYIIGALVDHNSQKGLCLKIAQEYGISHAKLPIQKYMDMKTRQVLAINHVYEILLCVSEGKSWQDAFLAVLPKRKGAQIQCDNSIKVEELSE